MIPNNGIKTRDLTKTHWYWVDKAILGSYGRKLGPAGIAVYNALAFFANGETESCFPAQQTIADLIGESKRTVARRIRVLAELGLVKVEKRRRGCHYYLLTPEERSRGMDKKDTTHGAPVSPPRGHEDTSPVKEGDTVSPGWGSGVTGEGTGGSPNKNKLIRIINKKRGEMKISSKGMKGLFNDLKSQGLFEKYTNYEEWAKEHDSKGQIFP